MQNRIADIDKRQLKKAPTANDIAWSLRKREILAMNKVRFATTQTGYHNIKRKHLIGFDRLASRLPSRGIGAQQNENDLINRVVFHTMSQNDLLANNKRELRQESGIPRSFSSVNEADMLEAKAEDRNDIRQERLNIADSDDDEFEEITDMVNPDNFMRKFTLERQEAYLMSPSVAARIETDKKNEMMVLRSRSYSTTEVPTQRKKPEQTSIPIQFAVSGRGVTTSGVYNPNDRKIRKTKNYKDASIFQVNEESLQSPVVTKKRV